MHSVAVAVSQAIPSTALARAGDLHELQADLDEVAGESLRARRAGLSLAQAVRDPRFSALVGFHRDLIDALFVEMPADLTHWLDTLSSGEGETQAAMGRFTASITAAAARVPSDDDDLQHALAEFLVFEAVCLRLYVAAWSSEDFERLGGEPEDLERIAWSEMQALLESPELHAGEVRPLQVIFAGAFVSMLRDAQARAGELRRAGDDLREELSMRARLRGALRELRLPEAVLLENALSNLLGQDRVELTDLQAARPLALGGLSRQAMDQRVSRGRRALGSGPQNWPRRRQPALFDRLRQRDQ